MESNKQLTNYIFPIPTVSPGFPVCIPGTTICFYPYLSRPPLYHSHPRASPPRKHTRRKQNRFEIHSMYM